jgi:hypothetical protein
MNKKIPNQSDWMLLLFFLLSFFSFQSNAYPAASSYYDTVQIIYIGYYQRPADPAGLIYWAGRLDSSGGNLAEIIEAFANSDESKVLYGTINSGNISNVVNNIYLSLFNRDAEIEGRDYYANGFNSGQFTAATIMLNVLSGAQNQDLQSVNNKLTAANLFTGTIDPDLDGSNFQLTYAGDADVIAGRNFLSLYATSVTVPTQAETTAYIRTNIAGSGDPILSQPPLWTTYTIDSIGNVGTHTSIAVDANEKVHISYYDFTNGKLKYATNATGSWVTLIVDSGSDYGTGIALGANGKVHIVYDGAGGDLKYATNATGSWVISTVESGAYSGILGNDSIAIDSYGKVHISYFKASGFDLKYATNASGTWSTSIIVNGGATGPLPGYSASIGVDSNNKIHISYYDDALPDSIKYVTNMSGSWVVTTIGTIGLAAGWETSLAIDSNNKVHISYYVWTNDVLKYASNASGTWQTEFVDQNSGGVSDASLAIDKANGNQINVVYSSYSDFKYATKLAGTWQISKIDESWTGGNNSVAIGSSSIHVSYYDGYNTNLKYATRPVF